MGHGAMGGTGWGTRQRALALRHTGLLFMSSMSSAMGTFSTGHSKWCDS